MANRLVIVFVVLVALTRNSFCTHDSPNSQNEESTKPPVSSSYDQSQDKGPKTAITEQQSSGYGQDNAGDKDNKAEEGQSPGDSPHTEPTSPSGSSDGHASEKDKAGSGGEDNTQRNDESIHFPDDNTDAEDRWKLMNLYYPTSGYAHDHEQDQTDASGKKNINDKEDNKEGQDLGDSHHTEPTSSPPGSSHSNDGGKYEAGSEGKDNKNDQDDKKNDKDSKAEDQKPGGAQYTESAPPSGSGYGHDTGKDQTVSGGEKSTNDQNDDKNDQGDNTKGQKEKDSLYVFPVYTSTSRSGYDSESEKTDSEGKDSANEQDDGKNDQGDNTKGQKKEDSSYPFPSYPSILGDGYDSGKDQDLSEGENNTNDQDHEKKDQGDNAEGEKPEDFSYLLSPHLPTSSYGYDNGKDQDVSGDENNTNDQDDDKDDQDDNADNQYNNAEGQDQEGSHYNSAPNHGQSHNAHRRYHPDSNYGHGSEQGQSGAGDDDDTYGQDKNGDHKDNNAEGQDQEGSEYNSGPYHGQSHNGEDGQTDATSEGNSEQPSAEGQENTEDQDGNQGSTGQGVDIGVSEHEGESLTKLGADNVLLIGERDNTIILESNGKNVTLGSSTIEVALALMNNVTLEHYRNSKSSNVILRGLERLLKNSDSKGSYHVIKSPHN